MTIRVYASLRVFALSMVLMLSACTAEALRLEPEILRVLPHDPSASTQGLLLDDGLLYESTGLYGQSRLRVVRPEDGVALQEIRLSNREFGEGLALVGDRLIQLTWREGIAYLYDKQSLARVGAFRYEGEGWGLCFDGEVLWMSDGSAALQRRDQASFRLLGRVEVKLGGQRQSRLNELACVGPHIYANVFQTDRILKIDKETGQVRAIIDASALVRLERQFNEGRGVLNGIAWIPGTDRFFLTGKRWSRLYEVRLIDPERGAVKP